MDKVITVNALQEVIITESFNGFTDTVSEGYNLLNACGPISYSIDQSV